MKQKVLATLTSLILMLTMVMTAPLAHAQDIHSYRIAFTNGYGLKMRHLPVMTATLNGAYPEGGIIPAECQDYGDSVTNVYGEESSVWVRSPGGIWWPTAYLDTGVNAWIDGLPSCAVKDYLLRQQLEGPAVSTMHQLGHFAVIKANPENTSARIYYSHEGTKQAANELQLLRQKRDFGPDALCAAVGVLVGGATAQAVKWGLAISAGVDGGCDWATASQPTRLDAAVEKANWAVANGQCLELRVHKDATGEWALNDNDGLWATSDPAYCG